MSRDALSDESNGRPGAGSESLPRDVEKSRWHLDDTKSCGQCGRISLEVFARHLSAETPSLVGGSKKLFGG